MPGDGRIIALTSDHTVGNLPYGASKGALDRITLAAAHELGHLGVSANVINPGPVDTGWMTDPIRDSGIRRTPLNRLGTPHDTANLVDFLCSPRGSGLMANCYSVTADSPDLGNCMDFVDSSLTCRCQSAAVGWLVTTPAGGSAPGHPHRVDDRLSPRRHG